MPTADWKKLRHAEGPATHVPGQVAAMTGQPDLPAFEAAGALGAALVGDGKWFSATPPAAALLLDRLRQGRRKHFILMLVADMVGADHARAWMASAKRAPKEVEQVVLERADAILRAATSKDASERATALVLLAMIPALGAKGLARVKERATEDTDDIVRASAILALACLGGDDAESLAIVRRAMERGEGIVRGAGAMALLRMDSAQRMEDVASGIEAWLGHRARPTILPWFSGRFVREVSQLQISKGPAQGLVALARSRGEATELEALALRLGVATENGVVAQSTGQILLELGGFTRFRPNDTHVRFVALAEELTPAERALAKRLSATTLLPKAGMGLPAAGACRKTWIGVAAPSALDKAVQYKTKAGTKKNPLWRAWHELEADGQYGDPLPKAIDGRLDGFDRWHVLVEFGASSYGGGIQDMTPDELEKELARLPTDSSFFDRIAQVADDLSSRYAAAEREGDRIVPTLMSSCLLFLPLIRSKRRIEARWDLLVCLSDEPPAREVLEAVPDDRREALIFMWTPREDDDNPFFDLDRVVPVFDMAPSERIARRIAAHLANKAVLARLADFDSLPRYEEKIRLATKKVPALTKVFKGIIK